MRCFQPVSGPVLCHAQVLRAMRGELGKEIKRLETTYAANDARVVHLVNASAGRMQARPAHSVHAGSQGGSHRGQHRVPCCEMCRCCRQSVLHAVASATLPGRGNFSLHAFTMLTDIKICLASP